MIHAVIGILKREDKLLIGERPPNKSYPGYWEFPGGKVELNETPEHALQRELREELGIETEELKRWYEFNFTYPTQTVHLELWHVEKFMGEPQGMENQKLAWVSLDEMVQMNLLPGMWPVIEKLKG